MDATTWIDNTTASSVTMMASNSNNDIGQTVLFVASIVIGILGILGNGLVIVVCFVRPLHGITNIVICNQSLIDFLSSVSFLLLYTLPDYRSDLPANPIAAAFVCAVWVSRYPLWVLAVSSTVNLEYITLEKYFAVMHPFKHRTKLTPLRAKFCAFIPWIYGLLHELPWALTHENRGESGVCSSQWQSDGLRFAVGIIAPLDHYVIPLLIICFCYTRMFFKIRAKTDLTRTASIARDFKLRKASHSVIKTMLTISIAYLICWGPNEFLYLYSNVGGSVNFSGLFHYYTVVSALCNMCVNPIIYMIKWRDFRERASDVLGLMVWCYGRISTHAQIRAGIIVDKSVEADSKI